MKFTQIPQDTFKELVLNAGVLLSAFSPDTAEVGKGAIIGATSGGLTFAATPSFSDFGEDIDNCPKNTKELKRLESGEVKLSGTFVSVNAANAKSMVAAADEAAGKITPRNDIATEDFKDIWLVADYSDKNGAKKGGFSPAPKLIRLNFYPTINSSTSILSDGPIRSPCRHRAGREAATTD